MMDWINHWTPRALAVLGLVWVLISVWCAVTGDWQGATWALVWSCWCSLTRMVGRERP